MGATNRIAILMIDLVLWIYLMIRIKEKNMYHSVSTYHKIYARITDILFSISKVLIVRIKGKVKNQRIDSCYVGIY